MEVTTINISLSINQTTNVLGASSESDSEFVGMVNTARYAINFVVTPILCIFGVVGNALNIVVLRRYGYKDTNVLLLESLSLADLILSVLHSFLHIHYIFECFDFMAGSLVGTFSFLYLFTPYQISLCVVEFHLVDIAFERVIAVFFPFHVSRRFLRSRVLMYIFVMYIFSLALNMPQYFVYEPGWMNLSSINQTIAVFVPTHFYLSNVDIMINYMIIGIGSVNTAIIPVITVLGCFLLGLKLLMRKKQILVNAKSRERNDLKGMRLLVAVCIISVLFCTSGLTLDHYFYINIYVFSGPIQALLLDITNLICQLFSSTNFFIYVTMSRKFFRTYRKLVCRF